MTTDGLAAKARERIFALGEPDLCLDWRSPQRNAVLGLDAVRQRLTHPLTVPCEDLLDLAAGVYLTDIAVQRGFREEWVREIELTMPVRQVEFWQESHVLVERLIHRLTRDRFRVQFVPWAAEAASDETSTRDPDPFEADCVCLLSGGLDSLAGAVLLLRTGRRPHFVLHDSGNATVRRVQRNVIALLEKHWPGQGCYSQVRVAPDTGRRRALPYPPPELREPSRRARSFLFLALGVVAAVGHAVRELYVCENGVLTAALPLTDARLGSFSTASTHPQVISLFSTVCKRAGTNVRALNPFAYQTKAQLIEDILRPVLGVTEIQRTVSCWAAGRRHRQCGGCVPCLLRRISMLAAGLPDEGYEIDLLGQAEKYRGTGAYTNLIDILSQATAIHGKSDVELLLEYPALLDLQAWGVSLPDVVTTLRRHSDEVYSVITSHFPETARLLGE